MSITSPTLSCRTARYRSGKKRSSSSSSDGSPESQSGSAKRTRIASPNENVTSLKEPSRSVSPNANSLTTDTSPILGKKCSSTGNPERNVTTTNATAYNNSEEKDPKNSIGDNTHPSKRSDSEELSETFRKRQSTKATVKADIESDHSVIEINESPESTEIRHQSWVKSNCGYDTKRTTETNHSEEITFAHRDTWTQKYAPNTFGTFVGNPTAVEKLGAWLAEWQEPTRSTRVATDTNSDQCPGPSNQPQQDISNALLIRGPPGIGKTALVYYIAHRFGYMVLEVNSSSERPGRRILADLQEATQSGHVEGTKISAGNSITSFFKPNLVSTKSSSANTPTTPTSSITNRGKGSKAKKSPAINPKGTLQNFFAPKTPPSKKSDPNELEESPEVKTVSSEPKSSIKSFFKSNKDTTSPVTSTTTNDSRPSLSPVIETQKVSTSNTSSAKIKCSKNMIILFDDVDVVFEDKGDEGFWMALETVVKNSKKPCILTVTQGYDSVVKRSRILQNAPLIELNRPEPTEVAALIKRICDMEQRDLTDYNVEFMCQYLASDVRRSLLQMEFETVASGLTQTVYPANKTIGGLIASGYIDDALAIQMAYKKVGFNALYASLEDCLPFHRDEDISGVDVSMTGRSNEADGETKISHTRKLFEISALCELSEVFDEFSVCDTLTGALDQMGQEYLPSYERAKRWMARHPMASQESNPRMVEELLEIEASVLLKKAVESINRISERFSLLDPNEQDALRFPCVARISGFHNIHSQLEKERSRETALDDVLNAFAISRPFARDYLAFLIRICEAEEDRRQMPRRSANRFVHYLNQLGLFRKTLEINRITNFWMKTDRTETGTR